MDTPQLYGPQNWEREMLATQATLAHRAIVLTPPPLSDVPSGGPEEKIAVPLRKKGRITRIIAMIIMLIAAVVIYFTWSSLQQNTSTQAVTTQNFNDSTVSIKVTSAAGTSATVTDSSNNLQVYIVGAVKRPGIYTLDANARVYQVLKDAGGPLPSANLVAINLAAPLKDGEEVYIPKIGEQVPANVDGSTNVAGSASTSVSTGALVNINTASADALRQQLHVSANTAQAIINYRLQHGTYTSVDQLANAVSKAIYNRIKGMVTI